MSESRNESTKNKSSWISRHPVLTAIGTTGALTAAVVSGMHLTNSEQAANNEVTQASQALNKVAAIDKKRDIKIAKKIGDAKKAADNAQKAADDAKKLAEDEASKSREKAEQLNSGLENLNSLIQSINGNLSPKVAANRKATHDLRKNIAQHVDPKTEKSYILIGDFITPAYEDLEGFSLTTLGLGQIEESGNKALVRLYNKNDQALDIIKIHTRSSNEIELEHIRNYNKDELDADGKPIPDGKLDRDRVQGGLFLNTAGKTDVTDLKEELTTVIKSLSHYSNIHPAADEEAKDAKEVYDNAIAARDAANTAYTQAVDANAAAVTEHDTALTSFNDSVSTFDSAVTVFRDADAATKAAAKIEMEKKAKLKEEAEKAKVKAEKAKDETETVKAEVEKIKKAAEKVVKHKEEEWKAKKGGKAQVETDFNNALARFYEIGAVPTHENIAPEARTLVEFFKDVAESGRYVSDKRISSSVDELDLDQVVIERVDADNYTLMVPNKNPVRELKVEKIGMKSARVRLTSYDDKGKKEEKVHTMGKKDLRNLIKGVGSGKKYTLVADGEKEYAKMQISTPATVKRGHKMVTFTRGGIVKTYEVPTTYITEMVNAWEKAQLNEKDSALELKGAMTSIDAAIEKLAKEQAIVESREVKYDSGMKSRVTSDSTGDNTSGFLRVASVGPNEDVSADIYHKQTSVTNEDNGVTKTGDATFVNVDFNSRTGVVTGTSDDRPAFTVSLFGQGHNQETTNPATAPDVTLDGDFQTTTEYKGGTETISGGMGSVGLQSKHKDGKFVRAGIFIGAENITSHDEMDVTVVDTTGTNPTVYDPQVIDGKTENEYWGVSFQKELANSLIAAKLMSGKITATDGSTQDYSEGALGAYLRHRGTDGRLLLGIRGDLAKIADQEISRWDALLDSTFKGADNIVLGVRAGYNFGDKMVSGVKEEDAFWRGGLTFAVGGKTPANTIAALDDYQLGSMVDSFSGQYTQEALAVRDHWRRIGALKNVESNLIFSLNGEEMYDADGEKGISKDISVSWMSHGKDTKKRIFSVIYNENPFAESLGAELGYFGNGNILSLGYQRNKNKGGTPDQDAWVASLAVRF